jgi:XTP/dITP diphosphohydrolase
MTGVEKIVIASNNRGKLKEIEALFSGKGISIVPQSDFSISDADETGLSFVENAIIKARHASEQSKLPAIADDSGIEVDILDGEPGIYSARFAGEGASDEDNLNLLLEKLKQSGEAKPIARFQCAMVYLRHASDPTPLIAQRSWQGHIVFEPRGSNGFGYDPIFYIPDQGCTSAELTPQLKNKISHRAQAMQLLLKKLFNTAEFTDVATL